MITVIEPVCCGLEHVPVNTAMLQIIAAAFPDQRLAVLAESRHLRELRKNLTGHLAGEIQWHEIDVPSRRSSYLEHLRSDIPLLRSASAGHFGGPPDAIILLAGAASLIVSLKYLRATRQLQVPVQVVLHSTAAELGDPRSRNPIHRLQDLQTALRIPPHTDLQFLVLEHAVLQAILRRQPQLSEQFAAISHPILEGELAKPVLPDNLDPLRIAFLGLATPAKGFSDFLAMAERLSNEFPGRLEFHAIGSRPRGKPQVEYRCLASSPGADKLPRDEYLRRLQTMHYVCLPYRGVHYHFTASGVLLDALANAKPVLACSTPAIAECFAQEKPGAHVKDIDQLAHEIRSRMETDWRAHYRDEIQSVVRLRSQRLPGQLASQYRLASQSFLRLGI